MKKRTLVSILLALIFITFLIVYHNSFRIALWKSGVEVNSIDYIDIGINDSGNEYRVVFKSNILDNTVKVLLLTKNSFGVWHVTYGVSAPDPDTGDEDTTMGWMRFSGMRAYGAEHPLSLDREEHIVYVGNNAKKLIEIPFELLPSNVSVDVFQAEAVYVIHLLSYDIEPDTLNKFHMMDLLRQTDSIQ